MSRPYSLMIDPGHGGKDPGAVSRIGIKEKDIVLSIGLIMQKMVTSGDYLFTPFMTRIYDKFITLNNRCLKANELNVDAFLSIHTNAREKKGWYGLELEAWIYPGSSGGLKYGEILIEYLSNVISGFFPVINRGVKEKAFYVLKHTTMPAALIELGFITDEEEAKFLIGWKNQRMIARALADASEHFLEGGHV